MIITTKIPFKLCSGCETDFFFEKRCRLQSELKTADVEILKTKLTFDGWYWWLADLCFTFKYVFSKSNKQFCANVLRSEVFVIILLRF